MSNGVVGLRYLLQPDGAAQLGPLHWIVAAVTLAVMVAANVWSRGVLGLSCALVGMVAGYAVAVVTGLLPVRELAEITTLAPLALPSIDHIGLVVRCHAVATFHHRRTGQHVEGRRAADREPAPAGC